MNDPAPAAPDTPAIDDEWSFSDLVDSSSHASIVVDGNAQVIYASPRTVNFTGMSGDEARGANVFDFVHPDSAAAAVEAWLWLVEQPQAARRPFELHLVQTGPRRLIEVTAADLMLDGASATALTLRDVTCHAMEEQIADSVMRSDPIDATLDLIVQLAMEELRGGGAVVVYEARDGEFQRAVHRGASVAIGRACTKTQDPTDGSPWALAARSHSIVHQTVARLGDDVLRAHVTDLGFKGCFAAPLQNSLGQSLGCLIVWTPDETPTTPGEAKYLAVLAEIAGFALERWSRDLQLAYRARHDVLTGLPNRLRLHEDVSIATGDGEPAALMLVDLDGFKKVNDEAGHLVGDQVLIAISDRFEAIMGEGDLLCRLGGDEFAVLCPSVRSSESVIGKAARLIESAGEPVDTSWGLVKVGASVGIRIGPLDDAVLSTALAEADAAMYEAKARGGAQWSRFGSTGPGNGDPTHPQRTSHDDWAPARMEGRA